MQIGASGERHKPGDLRQRLDWQSAVEKIHEFYLLGGKYQDIVYTFVSRHRLQSNCIIVP